jgi:hypothetical protein
MRLFEMIDLADMLGGMGKLEPDALAMSAGRKAPALITVTSCGMSGCAAS